MNGCTYCGRPVHSRGLCAAHERRQRLGKPMETPLRRFWTAAEDDRLRQWYADLTVALTVVAKSLGRSHAAVACRANELGLTDYHRVKPGQAVLQFNKSATPMTPEEQAAFTSIRTKKYIAENGHPRGMKGKHHDSATKERLGALSKERWRDPASNLRSPEAMQRRSDNALRMNINRREQDRLETSHSRTKGGRRGDLDNRYFRSSWEANYARYLNWLVSKGSLKSWQYEPKTFVFEAVKRGIRSYTPDFLVVWPDGSTEWHEVKGWLDPKSQTRLARMAKYFPEEKIVIRGERYFHRLNRSALPGLIPNWEHKPKQVHKPRPARAQPNFVPGAQP
jgi:hypothetical protein